MIFSLYRTMAFYVYRYPDLKLYPKPYKADIEWYEGPIDRLTALQLLCPLETVEEAVQRNLNPEGRFLVKDVADELELDVKIVNEMVYRYGLTSDWV